MKKMQVYSGKQSENIAREFERLKDVCYLDHAGATLYSEKQLQDCFTDLSRNVFANPHGRSTSSQNTIDEVDIIRYRILSFFNTDPQSYSVIFTSGTTQGLKMIAETFDYNGGPLLYLEDNHTSVLGMRNLAPETQELNVEEVFEIMKENSIELEPSGQNGLFVYPAESNFSGAKYPLDWIASSRKGILNQLYPGNPKRFYTLLDAATYVSTNSLDLSKYHPDFVVMSFYKIFGYPTGLGALLVKRESEDVLKKKYFGGGTVLMALSKEEVMIPKLNIHERFEDGTISYLSIISLKHGFDTFRRLQINPTLIALHTFNLAKYTYENLAQLHHFNGEPVAEIYCDTGFENINIQGGIVNFNLRRCSGDYVGYAEVLHLANLHGIILRTGCFCNPGACQRFLRLTVEEVKRHFEAGHICGDENDLMDRKPTGSIRISFGFQSTYEDAENFLKMIEACFVTHPAIRKSVRPKTNVFLKDKNIHKSLKKGRKSRLIEKIMDDIVYTDVMNYISGRLSQIYLYPIKSCAPFEVKYSWKLTKIGLQYDRRWMIINASGSCVSQKQIKKLCLLKPTLDLESKQLILTINGSSIAVPLEVPQQEKSISDSKVCGDKVQGFDCGNDVAEFLSHNLEKDGLRLLRQCDFEGNVSARSTRRGEQSLLSLANKAEYLLINKSSIQWLQDRIPSEEMKSHDVESIILRFRANFVVDFPEEFIENDLESIVMDGVCFKFSGHCTRCQMICIDQKTGDISKEPLQTLSKELEGKMRFGVYLSQSSICDKNVISRGSNVKGYLKMAIE